MSMMPKLQHFAAVCGVVLSTLLSTSVFAAPMHHSVTAADLSPYGGTAGANIGCQGGGCVVADDILGISNSGDNYLLGVYADLFEFSVDNLTIWDKYDTDTDSYKFGHISVEAEDKKGTWTLNASSTGSFDPSLIVGFVAKLGPYSVFLNFLDPDVGVGDEFLVESLKSYAKAILPAADFGNGSQFNGGGFSHLVVIGTVTAVPLPAALPLAASAFGLIGLLGWRRSRRTA